MSFCGFRAYLPALFLLVILLFLKTALAGEFSDTHYSFKISNPDSQQMQIASKGPILII